MVAIRKHQDMLDRIRAYHVVLEFNEAEDEVPGNPLIKTRLFEEWRAGIRRHVLKRTYVRNSARVTDTRVHNPQGHVVEYLVDARETRVLEGWNRERPFTLPLDFIRAPVEFGRVYCQLGPTDPLEPPEQDVAIGLLWSFAGNLNLEQLAKTGQCEVIDQGDPNIVRLRLSGVRDPKAEAWMTGPDGFEIELQATCGYAISQLAIPYSGTIARTQATGFTEPVAGVWVPSEVTTTLDDATVYVTKVLTAEFNDQVDDAAFQLNFPEGALVVEWPSQKRHLWGHDDQPARTFSTARDWQEFSAAAIREYQSRHRQQGHPPAQGRPEGSLTLLIVNFVLVGLLILFTILRRRLARAGGPPPEAP